jgi:hypothetical protein
MPWEQSAGSEQKGLFEAVFSDISYLDRMICCRFRETRAPATGI